MRVAFQVLDEDAELGRAAERAKRVLRVPSVPCARPVMPGVRRLRTIGGKDGKIESPVLSCKSSGMGH